MSVKWINVYVNKTPINNKNSTNIKIIKNKNYIYIYILKSYKN